MKVVDLVGQTFSRLTVVSRSENGEDGRARWLCKCQCGNEKVIRSAHLKNGATTSCGCFQIENNKEKCKTHGLSGTREYESWNRMLRRCNNLDDKDYHYYGGRGIKVCERWDKFENFLEDIGNCPDGMSLERKNNDLGYYKENCCWETKKNQSRNRRDTVYLTHNGETKPLATWAEELGLRAGTIHQRLFRKMPIEEVLRPADNSVRSTNKMLTLNGESHSITDWAKITGISRKLLTLRVHYGWSDERILTEPNNKPEPMGDSIKWSELNG